MQLAFPNSPARWRGGTPVARKVELQRNHLFEEEPALPVLFKLIRTTLKISKRFSEFTGLRGNPQGMFPMRFADVLTTLESKEARESQQ